MLLICDTKINNNNNKMDRQMDGSTQARWVYYKLALRAFGKDVDTFLIMVLQF